MAGASAPSPRARLASNCTWPLSSVRLSARTSLLRESSRTSVAPLGCVVSGEIALEIAPHHRLEQIAVADAVDFERHRRGIDAHHRNATLPGPRQHVSLAGEARLRLAIAHIDVEVRGFRQRLPHLRGNAG